MAYVCRPWSNEEEISTDSAEESDAVVKGNDANMESENSPSVITNHETSKEGKLCPNHVYLILL